MSAKKNRREFLKKGAKAVLYVAPMIYSFKVSGNIPAPGPTKKKIDCGPQNAVVQRNQCVNSPCPQVPPPQIIQRSIIQKPIINPQLPVQKRIIPVVKVPPDPFREVPKNLPPVKATPDPISAMESDVDIYKNVDIDKDFNIDNKNFPDVDKGFNPKTNKNRGF